MKTNQEVPETVGEIVRCINESLALKYRAALEEIMDSTGKTYPTMYMVGGGIQSKLLCQMTANSCNCKVSSGPVEATVLGNIAIQLMASNEIESLEEARSIIRNSQGITYYEPQDKEEWDKQFNRFKEIIQAKEVVTC